MRGCLALQQLAKTHYENFHIGSMLFPRKYRRALWDIYAYCRTVDDIGDEATGDRIALLDSFERELDACFGGTPTLPLMQALGQTIRKHQLPAEPFYHLIEANRRDQYTVRYNTFEDLLDYCAYSANPVGRLVLALLDLSTKSNVQFSDATCTALQLTNFWQDVAIDLQKGRVYIPQEDMNTSNYSMHMLYNQVMNEAWIRLMRLQIDRTRAFFNTGEQLLQQIPGRLRMEIALFSMGGLKILDMIETNQYDVFSQRLKVSKREKTRLFWRALFHYPPWKRGV